MEDPKGARWSVMNPSIGDKATILDRVEPLNKSGASRQGYD